MSPLHSPIPAMVWPPFCGAEFKPKYAMRKMKAPPEICTLDVHPDSPWHMNEETGFKWRDDD